LRADHDDLGALGLGGARRFFARIAAEMPSHDRLHD